MITTRSQHLNMITNNMITRTTQKHNKKIKRNSRLKNYEGIKCMEENFAIFKDFKSRLDSKSLLNHPKLYY